MPWLGTGSIGVFACGHQRLVDLLPFGVVANRRRHENFVVDLERSEPDACRKLAAIGAPCKQIGNVVTVSLAKQIWPPASMTIKASGEKRSRCRVMSRGSSIVGKLCRRARRYAFTCNRLGTKGRA